MALREKGSKGGEIAALPNRPFAAAKSHSLVSCRRLSTLQRSGLIGFDYELGIGASFKLTVKPLHPVKDGYITASHGFSDFLPSLALRQFPYDCLVVELI